MMSEKKNFYTVGELIGAPWFPVKSDATIKRLVEFGKLDGINISVNPKYRRYRITKQSVVDFLADRDERYKK